MRIRAITAFALIATLLAGPALAQDPVVTHETLQRIRDAVGRPPALTIENGQLKIYVEVIGNWPTFAQATKGYDFMNGPTGKSANPMSHQEFVQMVTPKELFGSGGISAGEVLTMAAVNAVGQWAIVKALNRIGAYRRDKQMRDLQAQIDAELAALKKIK